MLLGAHQIKVGLSLIIKNRSHLIGYRIKSVVQRSAIDKETEEIKKENDGDKKDDEKELKFKMWVKMKM